MNNSDLTKGQKAWVTRVVNELKEKAEEANKDIRELHKKLVTGSEEKPSVAQDIESIKEQASNDFIEINQIHDKLFTVDPRTRTSLAERIISFQEDYEKAKKEIKKYENEIEDYYDTLFGYEDEKGTKHQGIAEDIDEYLSKIGELYKTNQTKQQELLNDIESLLKGASTVALAKSFYEHKVSFNKPNNQWSFVFISSIVAMMALSVVAFVLSDFKLDEAWKYTLGNLPFLGGAIWLAIFSSKQRSQNKRLQQEYAFKEDVAKVYYGLKKEIEEIDDTDLGERLNKLMLETIVNVVSDNPSATLDSKSHDDRGPILQSLESIKDILKNSKLS